MVIACPITNTHRGVPFHLRIPVTASVTGVVMVDQIKSVDYIARRAKLIGPAPAPLLDDVLALLDTCVK